MSFNLVQEQVLLLYIPIINPNVHVPNVPNVNQVLNAFKELAIRLGIIPDEEEQYQ